MTGEQDATDERWRTLRSPHPRARQDVNVQGTVRFVSWNLSWQASSEQRRGQIDLLRRLAPDLLAVQEVSAARLRLSKSSSPGARSP
jgi:hypothetical protein